MFFSLKPYIYSRRALTSLLLFFGVFIPPFAINILQQQSLRSSNPFSPQSSTSHCGLSQILLKIYFGCLQLEIVLKFTAIIISFTIMNFFFSRPQLSQYSIQVYNASSKKPLVSQNWPSQENWQNQNENNGNKNGIESHIVLGNQGASQANSQPHSFAHTDYSVTKPSLTKQYNQQFSVVHSQKISKKDIYQVLRNPRNVLGNPNSKNSSLFVKMVKQSIQYDQIIKSNNKKWNDKSFQKQSQFIDCQGKVHPLEWKDVDWIKKYFNQQIKIITYPVEQTDVVQGKLGDCYFAAAIAALANSSRPERIFRLLSSIQINEQGIFVARLMFKGILQQVVVDSTFPFLKNGKNSEGKLALLGCSPNKNCQIYTMILQKCWAKLWKSYQTIDGGYPHQALHALSGALTKNYVLSTETDTVENKDKFFKQILNYHWAEYVMCAGTAQTETMNSVDVVVASTQEKKTISIASGHIYCVSQIIEKNNERKVKIYNPWGYNISVQNKEIQGDVQISWDRFIAQFQYITVCKLHDNANYLYQQLKFEPNKLKFMELTVRQSKTGYFAITISETDKKQKASQQGEQYLNVTYIVVKVIRSSQGEQYELITIRSEYQFSDHYLELHDITEGEYLIAVHISDAIIKEDLTFGVYSEDYFGFKEKQNVSAKFENNFIPNVLLNYHQNAPQQKNIHYPVANNKNIWISFNILNHRQARLGYYLLHVSEGQKAYQISFGRNQFEQFGLSVLYPYNKECFKLVAQPGYESIAALVISDMQRYEQRVINKRELYKLVRGKPQYKR